ncbi:hypothetical protein GIB67_032045 [Kingdonia uniflora]|uniref:Uncharacterized protein n=1 Tax=Kingdonia uniflora TaxID=39325 RepID=A0A7J7MWR5_9MAGN|nr:hypothetical protein GIB67_032045 [Kingdonia uniflora]
MGQLGAIRVKEELVAFSEIIRVTCLALLLKVLGWLQTIRLNVRLLSTKLHLPHLIVGLLLG